MTEIIDINSYASVFIPNAFCNAEGEVKNASLNAVYQYVIDVITHEQYLLVNLCLRKKAPVKFSLAEHLLKIEYAILKEKTDIIKLINDGADQDKLALAILDAIEVLNKACDEVMAIFEYHTMKLETPKAKRVYH